MPKKKVEKEPKAPRIKTPEELRKERIAKAITDYADHKNKDCLMEFFNEEFVTVLIMALDGAYGKKIPAENVTKFADTKYDALHLNFVFTAIASGDSDRMVRLFANMAFNEDQLNLIQRGISKGLSEEQIVSYAHPNYSIDMMERIIVREITRMKFLKPLLEKHKMDDFSKAYEVKDLLYNQDKDIEVSSFNNYDEYSDALMNEYKKHHTYVDALLYMYDDTPYVSMENIYVCRYRENGSMINTYKAVTICIRTRCGTKPSNIKWSDLEFIIKTMIANDNEASKYPYENLEMLRMNLNSVGSEITIIYKIKE